MQWLRLSTHKSLLSCGSCRVFVGGFEQTITSPIKLLGGLRFRHSKRVNPKVQAKLEGGIQYYGFKFFPRFPDHKDPPYEPTKLFMVKRIRSMFGLPYWEKDVCKHFGIEDRGTTAVVENTPKNNAKLYIIKHIVEITPITTPYGLPDEPEHAFLKENGELIACKSLIEGHELQLEDAKLANERLMKKSVDGTTLKSRLRARWYSRWG